MGPAHRLRAVLVRFGGASFRSMMVTGLALAAIVALIAALVWADRELPAGESAGEVVRVGVVEGQPVGGYLDAARHEMAVLTDPSAPAAGDTWALVTFRGYASPDRLPALLTGATVAQVYVRAPLPDARTAVTRIPVYRLPDDVTAGMTAAALARDREQAEYQRLSRALTGAGRNEVRLRAAYEAAARTAGAEADAYRSGCECVFAAVVRATPDVLGGLAARPVVRVVDPAPEVRQLDRTEFRPPLPEESAIVPAAPSTPAVPSAPAAVASTAPAPIPSSVSASVTSASPERSAVAPSPAVQRSERAVAVPSAADVSPVRDGFGTPSAEPAR